MNQSSVRIIVASIVIFGHFLVFIFGAALSIFGPLNKMDSIQTILMTTPVLAAIAMAAFRWVIANEVSSPPGLMVSAIFSVVCIFFPTSLIACIFVIFYLTYMQIAGFGPDEMKIALGAIETFFGAFLGSISDTLFGKLPAEKVIVSRS